MFKFNIGLTVLGLAMLAATSTANAQCSYANGYTTTYTPAYQSTNYYTPTYQYGGGYVTPSYRYNQGYGYNNVGRDRLRRALVVAAVAGAVIAASNSDNDRNRNRNRNRGRR